MFFKNFIIQLKKKKTIWCLFFFFRVTEKFYHVFFNCRFVPLMAKEGALHHVFTYFHLKAVHFNQKTLKYTVYIIWHKWSPFMVRENKKIKKIKNKTTKTSLN